MFEAEHDKDGEHRGGPQPDESREQRLRLRLRQESALAKLGHVAVSAATPWELMQAAATAVGEALEVEFVEVLELVDDGSSFRVRGVHGHGVALGAVVPTGVASQAGYTLVTDHPVVVDDLTAERRFKPPGLLAEARAVSGASVVIHGRSQPFGVLGAHSLQHRVFDSEEVSFLQAVASLLAAALERTWSEEARQRSEASFRTLIESAPDFVLVRRRGRIVWVNPMLSSVLGVKGEGLLGRSVLDLVPFDDRERAAAHMADEAAGNHLKPHEGRLMRADGTVVAVEWVGIRLDFEGEPAWLSFGRDLTERLHLQARMAMTDRLVSVGTLAAGVAHELNNPLTYVLGNLEVISNRLGALAARVPAFADAEQAIADLRLAAFEALDGARRMRQIVTDLRGISRADDNIDGAVDLSEVVRAAVNLTRAEIRRRAELEVLVASVPAVRGNTARLGQVLVNLLVNAAQAIPPNAPERNRIRVDVQRPVGGMAILEVSDTGDGIPPDVLPRIFEPFFTTKAVGVGTGLGLWICHNVVSGLGGRIEVDSRPGEGTCFRVFLPVAGMNGEGRCDTAGSSGAPRATRRQVLVIDDEPQVGALVRRALAMHDVTVVEAATAALALLRAGRRFDVIICDVLMPVMSGLEFLSTLSRELPEQAARVLLVSGALGDGMPSAASGAAFLAKPFSMDALIEAAERVAESKPVT